MIQPESRPDDADLRASSRKTFGIHAAGVQQQEVYHTRDGRPAGAYLMLYLVGRQLPARAASQYYNVQGLKCRDTLRRPSAR